MNRRHFLKASAVAAATAGLKDQVLGSTRGDSVAIKKAVKYGMVKEGKTILEKFQLVKELGFDGIEMNSPSSLDRDEVVAARNETGLVIHGVVDSKHWKDTLSDPDAKVRVRGIAALKTALSDAKRYGGDTVLLVPGRVTKKVSYDQVYERSQAEIRKALPLAAQLGIKIALENVWNDFLLSPLEAARYIDEFESPWIGWYLDVGNIVNYGWPEHWVRILGKRIFKLDAKGFSRAKRNNEGLWKGFNVPIGGGDCDWPAVLEALKEIGWSGWVTAEVRGGDRVRLAQIHARMTKVLAG